MSAVKLSTFEFIEIFEDFFDHGISSGTNRKGDQNFAELQIAFFEVTGFVFDFENWFEYGGSNQIDLVGDSTDSFEGV